MIVLVAGGTGFVGRRVVELLEQEGHKVIIYHTKRRAVPTKADAIVNCIGIIKEGPYTFKEVHVDVTNWLLGLGQKLQIKQFVQISAIGARLEGVPYQRTKRQAEIAVENSGLPYTIIRPSVLFGEGNKSISMFRKISRSGFFPLFANGKVQPVHVSVVAQLVKKSLEGKLTNQTVEVGGPETFTYRALLERIHPGVITFRLPRPIIWVMTLFARFTPLPTKDMVRMLGEDNLTLDKTAGKFRIKQVRVK